MKIEKENFEGQELVLYYFSVPMMHRDFHEAEDNGLVYIKFSADGNDYWDYNMIWAKKEQESLAKQYFESCW